MGNDFDIAIEKFMDRMGITYTLEISKGYRDTQGRRTAYVEVIAYRNEKKEFEETLVFILRDGGIVLQDIISSIGVKDGIFVYLGNDLEVYNYFDGKAREVATKYLTEKF